MNNTVFGVIVIVICSIGYFLSWNFFSKGKTRMALLFLLLCGLGLRFFSSSDFYLHEWDERFHALVAKNLIRHPFIPTLYDTPVLQYDYKNWAANHIWLHKQPFPLWTIAGSISIFGVNELSVRIPSILLTTVAIGLTFYIGRHFYNRKVGFIAALLFSINGLILDLSTGRAATDHIDIFFLFFIEIAIFFSIVFAEKSKILFNILAGACIGLAILSKWLPALIVFPIWWFVIIHSRKFQFKAMLFHFLILTSSCLLIALPWQMYIHSQFPLEADWTMSFNVKHFTESVDKQGEPFYYYLNRIRIDYGELIYLPIIWQIWNLTRDVRNLKIWAIVIWFLIPITFFSISVTKMGGYILFSAPALFIVTAAFFVSLNDYKKNKRHKWFYNLVLFLLIALPIRYTIERMKPFDDTDRSPEWVNELKKLNELKIDKGVLLNYERPIEAMFYTDLTVYPDLPDKEAVAHLVERGYSVIINDDGRLPGEILFMKDVQVIKLNGSIKK